MPLSKNLILEHLSLKKVKRIAINGFGRIGRAALKIIIDTSACRSRSAFHLNQTRAWRAHPRAPAALSRAKAIQRRHTCNGYS